MSRKLPARYIVKRRLLDIQELAERLTVLAQAGLDAIAEVEKVRIQQWRCKRCGNVLYFTMPVTVEACDACPKCGGIKFVPAGEESVEEQKES